MLSIRRADLDQLRLRGDGLPDVHLQLDGVAFRIGATVVLRPDSVKQERVVPGALWAINAGTSLGHQLRIVF